MGILSIYHFVFWAFKKSYTLLTLCDLLACVVVFNSCWTTWPAWNYATNHYNVRACTEVERWMKFVALLSSIFFPLSRNAGSFPEQNNFVCERGVNKNSLTQSNFQYWPIVLQHCARIKCAKWDPPVWAQCARKICSLAFCIASLKLLTTYLIVKLYYSLTFLYCFSWLQGIPSLTIWKTDIMLLLRRLVVRACRASRKGWKIPFVFETFDLWCELTFYECNKCFWRVVLHGAFLFVFVTVFFLHTCKGFDGKYFITSLAFCSHSIVVDDDEQSLCAFI